MVVIFENQENNYLGNRIPFKYMNSIGKLSKKKQWSLLKYKLDCINNIDYNRNSNSNYSENNCNNDNNEELIIKRKGLLVFFENCEDLSLIELLFRKKSKDINFSHSIAFILNVLMSDSIKSCTAIIYFLSNKQYQDSLKEIQSTSPFIVINHFLKYSKTDEDINYLELLLSLHNHKLQPLQRSKKSQCFYEIAIGHNCFKSLEFLIRNNISSSPNSSTNIQEDIINFLVTPIEKEMILKYLSLLKIYLKNNIDYKSFISNCNINSYSSSNISSKIFSMALNNLPSIGVFLKDGLLPHIYNIKEAILLENQEALSLFLTPSTSNPNLLNGHPNVYSSLFKSVWGIQNQTKMNSMFQILLDSKIYQASFNPFIEFKKYQQQQQQQPEVEISNLSKQPLLINNFPSLNYSKTLEEEEINIIQLIKEGKVYQALNLLSNPSTKFKPFSLDKREASKLIKYYNFDVIEILYPHFSLTYNHFVFIKKYKRHDLIGLFKK
ncbi:hypothetical protein RB653_000027 [Dictyostelium firmibasis]|uniref:Uncharacterized protein n=1 Tax=Dictyostelium firmibasis TaxID=79012 RepID=A0AAN7U291_9MYCE